VARTAWPSPLATADTRRSAVTNLVGAGVPDVVAVTVTGYADRTVFQRYNVRRDDVQADALARQEAYRMT
jgi:hypothetical protein